MKVLITGGTGRIGSAVAERLTAWGARVAILCRSEAAVHRVEVLEAEPVRGDIADPLRWIGKVSRFDAVIHAAATFDDTMGELDARVVAALLERLSAERRRRKLLYTGGVWVFGATDGPRDESAPYDPPVEWRWMADSAARVLRQTEIHGQVVHPAIVVEDDSALPRILVTEARESGALRLPCAAAATWPLVNRADLAMLYALVLDGAPAGGVYIGTSAAAVPVDRLAERVGEKLGIDTAPVEWPIEHWKKKYGDWASGYALSQHLVSDRARDQLGWRPELTLPD